MLLSGQPGAVVRLACLQDLESAGFCWNAFEVCCLRGGACQRGWHGQGAQVALRTTSQMQQMMLEAAQPLAEESQ